MAKLTASYSLSYGENRKPCSIADAVTGSVELAGDDDGQLERISSRLTKLAEIVGALAEHAVRSGDEQLASELGEAMHYRYNIEVE